ARGSAARCAYFFQAQDGIRGLYVTGVQTCALPICNPHLAALSSGYGGVEPFLLKVAEANGQGLRTVRPLMTNSDHANFAAGGIPAIRLVAGFDDPNAHLRVVLTPADTRDKVAQGELRQATLLTAALVAAACTADPAEATRWRL